VGLILSNQLAAESTNNPNSQSLFEQLSSINQQWLFQADINTDLKKTASYTTGEVALIQQHLRETEKLLRSRSVIHLNASQKKQRLYLLDVLHQYMLDGIFPKNTFHTRRTPYFIDIFNNYCAVGFLMKISGADKMAREINQSQNFSYVKEIKHPSLLAWQQFSGFTIDELALIQPGYSCLRTAITEIHYNNTGNDVNEYLEFVLGDENPINFAFNKIEFYDQGGVLYKTLTKSDFSFFDVDSRCGNTPVTNRFYNYLFPSNESFADVGSIRILYNPAGLWGNGILGVYQYNANTVSYTPYNGGAAQGTTTYPGGEDGNGSVGTSLNFCYSPAGYIPSIMPATSGTVNYSCLTILPLQLKNFDYTILDNKVQLTWQTASEINTARFEIERSSDGINFSKLGFVNAAVNSSVSQYYNYLDAVPANTNYYRLKQVDRDGKSVYSKILYAKLKTNSPLVLHTPIVTSILRLTVKLDKQDIQRIQYYDLTGRSRSAGGFKPRSGLNEIDVSSLLPGVYFLRLETTNGEKFGEKFIKQ
jgi:hypothetical protein